MSAGRRPVDLGRVTWLVTGGAGYIGAHVVRGLVEAGHGVVVLDDLSTGRAERLPCEVPLVVGAVADRPLVTEVLNRYRIDGVIHLAARKSPTESIARPAWYHRENVGGLAALLDAMAGAGVHRLLFSSSAAVYGIPPGPTVSEVTPTAPINPYGLTKLLGEQLIAAAGRGYGLSWLALRYFNVVGAALPVLADRVPTNLVPIALAAMSADTPITVTGADYPTRDGTGVRDYVHVLDLASAHLAAADRLMAGPAADGVYNVGTGQGHSVLEVLHRIGVVTGQPVAHEIGPRRAGDPPEVVADVSRIRHELGWRSRYGLTEMIASSWLAWSELSGTVPVR
ncbi:UDP-glucose 4-epimerase GalE [Rugosimonospora acidiphila]|uniref:UDP-glucose 4-epimerase n=1 Tax=Rugosimonospora acidiphila TaxID=556531 RepID=A0ABP9RSI6_9ACTN